jgi:hypothetical protein
MPLKKPTELPKIPKTRKKKAYSAIEAIPEPKPDKLEYICRAYFHYDKLYKKQEYILSVETIAEFTSFAYEVSVDVVREKREIYLVLMGLTAKTNIVPEIKPAVTEVKFDDLIGEYTVNVVKQDGAINSCKINFNLFLKEIKILQTFKPKKKNNRHFCDFVVDEEKFSFAI